MPCHHLKPKIVKKIINYAILILFYYFSLVVSFFCFLTFFYLAQCGNCPGICQPTSYSCPSNYVSGLCPGSSDIQCCEEPTLSCPGQCQLNSLSCNGNYTSGLCPGASDIQCCQNPSGDTCVCDQNMCTNIPTDNQYYLTSFCDPTVACGDPADCYDYFCADYKRFGCGTVITCCCNGNGKCTNLKVIDGGPACYVEEDAGKPVIDASYSMCQTCTNSISCGWSDRIPITCTVSNSTLLFKDVAGPCSYDFNSNLPKCVGELTDNMKKTINKFTDV